MTTFRPLPSSSSVASRLRAVAPMLGALLLGVTALGLASEALVLVPGGSRMLVFRNMRRVVVVEPTVADVVVASRAELVVFGKSIGHTKLYVWDAAGRHEYAVTVRAALSMTGVVRRLRDLMPPYLEPRAMGDTVLLLRGTCPSENDRTKALELTRQIAGKDAQIVDLTTIEGQDISPAERAAEYLSNLYGPTFDYVVWGDETVIVRGNVTPQTSLELESLNEALRGEVRITSVTTGLPPTTVPVDEIQAAVGPDYRVWALGTGTVVVEGEAQSPKDLERANKLLETFAGRAQLVNLVRLAPEPKPSLVEYCAQIKEAIGGELDVRAIGANSIAIEGVVPDEATQKRVEELLGALPPAYKVLNLVRTVTPGKRRLVVHVKIVDINRERLKRYGVDWGQIVDGQFVDQPWLVQVEYGVDNYYTLGADLHALETQNYAKILAEPNLVVNDGEEANMLVGGEIPVPIPQTGAGGFNTVTIEYKEYGVNLRIKPTITEQGQVETMVSPEVSSLDYEHGVTIAGFDIPGLRTRRASSTVTVEPGATLIIGGLIRSDETKLVKKIPLLADIPIIGELFKRRQFQEGKTELVIFLTPEILPPAGEGGTE